jgi:hypothetical protein
MRVASTLHEAMPDDSLVLLRWRHFEERCMPTAQPA